MKRIKAFLSVFFAVTLLALCFVPAFAAEEPCPHDWQQTEYVMPQGCRDGYIRYTCAQCGAEKQDLLVARQEHQWEWVVDMPPTPYDVGRQHQVCTQCGAVQNMNTAIPSQKGARDFGDAFLDFCDAFGGAIHDFILKLVDFFGGFRV